MALAVHQEGIHADGGVSMNRQHIQFPEKMTRRRIWIWDLGEKGSL